MQQKWKENILRKIQLKLRAQKEKKVVCARLKLSYSPNYGFAAKEKESSLRKIKFKLRAKTEHKVVCTRLKSSYSPILAVAAKNTRK